MSTEIDVSDAKADALGAFLVELENAAAPEAVVRRYSADYPQWARDFVEEAVFSRLLVTSRTESVFPDLSGLTDFRIIKFVAAGGMGVVYEAEQVSLRRRVALKVRYGPSSPEREERFLNEQQALARLHQSHIVPIHVAGQCGFWRYFAMAYIEGVTLHQLVKAAAEHGAAGRELPRFAELVKQTRAHQEQLSETARLAEFATELASHSASLRSLPAAGASGAIASKAPALPMPVVLPAHYFRSIAGVIADIADAVEHAHQADVIHRDVKPSNIMIDTAGQGWLIDFGLAHYVEWVVAETARSAPRPGKAAGTPAYMAPEQLRPEAAGPGQTEADRRTDVWGLGATLYEALTLRRPFEGATFEELSARVVSEPPPEMKSLVRNLPADLAAVCDKALHKDPARRYQRAADLAADLRRWLAGMPTAARPARPLRAACLWARRNKGWATALASALLLLIAFAAILVLDARHRARQSELHQQAAEERIRLHEREALLHEVRGLRSAAPHLGWSARAWDLVREAAAINADERLRDLAASTLGGLDARVARRLAFGASSVAFDDAGRRLLAGGLADSRGNPVRPASLWEIAGDRATESTLAGEGPVAFRRDGTALQLAFRSPDVVLWDLTRGKEVRTVHLAPLMTRNERDSLTLALAPDGGLVGASGRTDDGKGRTVVWEAASGKVVFEAEELADVIEFSPQGDMLATADSRQSRVVIRSLADGAEVLTIPAGAVHVRSLAFGPATRRPAGPAPGRKSGLLAVGDAGGSIAVWDLAAGMPVSFCRGSTRDVFALAFNPDGTLLASGGREEVRVWEVAAGKVRLRLHGEIDYIVRLAFAADGLRLAAATRGVFYRPGVVVWDLEPDRGMRRLRGLAGQVETVVLSPDGRNVAALSQAWEVGLWDLPTGRLRAVFEVPPGRSFADNAALTFSADGNQLAFAGAGVRDSAAILWDTTTGAELRRWRLPPGLQNRLGFDGADHLWHFQVETDDARGLPNSRFPYQKHPRVCRIRDLKGAEPTKALAANRDFNRNVYHAVATPDGRYFIADGVGGESGDQRRVRIIDGRSGKAVWTYRPERTTGSANLLLDALGTSALVAVTDTDRCLRITVPGGEVLDGPAFTPLAANARAGLGCFRTHEKASGCFLLRDGEPRPLVNLAPDGATFAAAFDATGNLLVWGGRDGTVMACDLPAIRARLEAVGLGW